MRLFVYGTLIEASGAAMARWLAPRLAGAVRASVPGRLYAIPHARGWYPALVAGRPHERAWGMACSAALGPSGLALLDRYEGREYRRSGARALTADGARLAVSVYRWHGPLPHGAEWIAGGDFLAWLSATGRSAYGRAPRTSRETRRA